MFRVKSIAAMLLTLAASRSLAQEHQHRNGEKLGTVHFATSCNAGAQKEFDRAVALLHSFQFSRAIEGFNAVLGEDATCGIAYWGIALSDWSNPFATGMKDKSQLQAGRESAERGTTVGAKTERERAYLGAVGKLYSDYESAPQRTRLISYRDAMGRVAAKYPEDHEAQIFYALAIAASEDPADKTYAGRLQAGAILEKLFEEQPTHPGLAHYIIHTYDVPALATHGLVAARRIVDSLPEIATRFDPKAVISGAGGPAVGYFALAAIPARYALERQDWKQAVQLPLRETPFPYTDALTWFARGLSAGRLGQATAANESATALQRIRERLSKASENYWERQVEIQEFAVRAWAALSAGKKEKALRQMKWAAELEDGTEKSAVTPGPLAPARELLGEMLLEMKEPAQALEQFEATLKKEPGRLRALYGAAQAAQLSGSRDTSQRYFREVLKVCGRADKPGRSEVTEAQQAILQN